MAASSTATTPPPLVAPGPHRRLGAIHRLSASPSFRPLPASSSPAVSASAASIAPKPKPRGLGLRCRAAEGAAPARGEAPLKVMISGAPASGKGTQCRMIVGKYGLVHISTGDLLRAEVSSGTEIGKKAKEYMDNGMLVPDQVVTDMVVSRLSQPDVRERGWLLDGYPRSYAQAQSLENMKIRPDIFIVLEVPDDILIDRCIGRRLDPVTGKIYHVKNFPPESEEISARLITRSDDTFEKVKSRLENYKQNSEAVLPTYSDLLNQIDGNRAVEVVFHEIDSLLLKICENASANKLAKTNGKPPDSVDTTASKNEWRGIPTRLNNIPHSREIRKYFYDDVVQATKRAIEDKKTRLKIDINIPELNPEMDVYRIGTLMELVRELSLSFADDGKRVKVCVQGSMGEGAFAGIPLQLAGSRKILEFMDWGDYGAKGTFINIGAVGASEVDKEDDMFVLIAPQNAVGNCIIGDMRAMTDAAGDRPVILVNPRLKDMPGSSGVMQTMGRDMRLKYAASFETCYSFRLLFYAGSFYPIMGALRMAYPNKHEIYRRVDEPNGKEKYVLIAEFDEKPTPDDITNAFKGRKKIGVVDVLNSAGETSRAERLGQMSKWSKVTNGKDPTAVQGKGKRSFWILGFLERYIVRQAVYHRNIPSIFFVHFCPRLSLIHGFAGLADSPGHSAFIECNGINSSIRGAKNFLVTRTPASEDGLQSDKVIVFGFVTGNLCSAYAEDALLQIAPRHMQVEPEKTIAAIQDVDALSGGISPIMLA